MTIKKNITISENGFLFDGSTGDSYSVNPIATEMMQLLQDEKSEEDICASIVRKYEVESYIVERHFFEFTNLLQHLNLID